MRLQLTVRQTGTMPGARDEIHRFERFPLVVGRAADCNLVLPDESRFISSNHAMISLAEDGSVRLRDTSSNGVFVNHAELALGRDNEVTLRDRDVIVVGDYELMVALDAATGDGEDPGEAGGDPFAILLDEPRPSDDAGDTAADARAGRTTGAMAAAGDPFAPFASDGDPFASGEGAAAEADARWDEEADDDGWADWPDASTGTPRAAPPAADSPGADVGGPTAHSPASAGSSGARRPPPPTRHPPASRAAPADPLVETLLLQCLDGLMALLRSRSELKHAMRSDVTMLAGTGNNPLKFSRDGREALARLSAPSGAGEYLAPEAALGEAIDDLALHQLAMLDGMQGAVAALLARFDPEHLAERLTADHPIAATIPLARDAKLWQLFRDHYEEIESTARDDLETLFGHEFRKAYEAGLRARGRAPEPW